MEVVYYAVIIAILLLTLPLGSRKLVYSADPRMPQYSPLNGLSRNGRHAAIAGAALITGILMVLCIFRPMTMPDIAMYEWMYDNGVDKINKDIEPSFGILARLSPSFLVLLAIYALLSVGLHVYAIFRNSPNIWLSLILYLCYTFVLHDMIQMRAAVAIGMMLVAVRYLRERKWYIYFPMVAFAFFFHYSALVFVFFYFLPTRHLNKWIWSAVLIVALIAGILNMHFAYIAKYIPLKFVQGAFEAYMGNRNYVAVPLGFARFIKIFGAIVMLFYQKPIVRRYPMAIPVLIFYMASQIAFLIFADIPVIQGRLGEMFCAFEIFGLAMFPLISKRHYYLLWIVPIAVALYDHSAVAPLFGV